MQEVSKLVYTTMQCLNELMDCSQSYPYPVENAKILTKVIYSNFNTRVKFLVDCFTQYANNLSEFGDSVVKETILQNLIYVQNIVKFTYRNERVRTKLNDSVSKIFKMCYNFLQF